MTKFNKANFHKDGDYLVYGERGWINGEWKNDCRFVARFKYGRGGAGSFKSFLIKNFTVEEYFGLMAQGENNPSKEFTPLGILEAKGYIMDHVKKWMKQAGYTTINKTTEKHWFENVYCKQFEKKVA